jgi:DNA invertase Pin-like site-specific DNA recombinase
MVRHYGKFVSYLRVSTSRQGRSGLGLEAQRQSVGDFLNGGRWALIREFIEVESGKNDDRPVLSEAIEACRLYGATLVIAKLDRLSRDAHFLLGLQKAGIKFLAADMPEANELVVGVMALVAQAERKMISTRTREALAAAKARGVKLGNPRGAAAFGGRTGWQEGLAKRVANTQARAERLRGLLAELQAQGILTATGLARALNERQVSTPRGGKWSARTVLDVLKRLSDHTSSEA